MKYAVMRFHVTCALPECTNNTGVQTQQTRGASSLVLLQWHSDFLSTFTPAIYDTFEYATANKFCWKS